MAGERITHTLPQEALPEGYRMFHGLEIVQDSNGELNKFNGLLTIGNGEHATERRVDIPDLASMYGHDPESRIKYLENPMQWDIREIREQISDLTSRVAELEADNRELRARNQQLNQRNQQLEDEIRRLGSTPPPESAPVSEPTPTNPEPAETTVPRAETDPVVDSAEHVPTVAGGTRVATGTPAAPVEETSAVIEQTEPVPATATGPTTEHEVTPEGGIRTIVVTETPPETVGEAAAAASEPSAESEVEPEISERRGIRRRIGDFILGRQVALHNGAYNLTDRRGRTVTVTEEVAQEYDDGSKRVGAATIGGVAVGAVLGGIISYLIWGRHTGHDVSSEINQIVNQNNTLEHQHQVLSSQIDGINNHLNTIGGRVGHLGVLEAREHASGAMSGGNASANLGGYHVDFYNPALEHRRTGVQLPSGWHLTGRPGAESIVDNHGKVIVKKVGWDSQHKLDWPTRNTLRAQKATLYSAKLGSRFMTLVKTN